MISYRKFAVILGIVLGAFAFVMVAVAFNAAKGSGTSHTDTPAYHLGYSVIGPTGDLTCVAAVDGYVDDHRNDLPSWFNRQFALDGCFDYQADLRINTP